LLKDLENGQHDFKLDERQQRIVDSFLEESESVSQFVKNRIHLVEGCELTTDEMSVAYGAYCREMDWKPESTSVFEKTVPDAMRDIHGKTKSHDCAGGKQRGFKGVALKVARADGSDGCSDIRTVEKTKTSIENILEDKAIYPSGPSGPIKLDVLRPGKITDAAPSARYFLNGLVEAQYYTVRR